MENKEEQSLKYLQFVQTASFKAVVCFSNVYDYAKVKSGPLKHGVDAVEGTVKRVAGPVYHKFHDVPIEVLKFFDRKIETSVSELDRHVPPTIKQISSKVLTAAQKAPELAQSVVGKAREAPGVALSMASHVQRDGVVNTASGIAKSVYTKYEPTAKELCSKCEPKAKELYSNYEPKAKEFYFKYEPKAQELYSKYEPKAKELYSKYEPKAKELYSKYEPKAKELYTQYEPKAEQCAVSAWHKLNQLPLFPHFARVVVIPAGTYCMEKYNQAVRFAAENGLRVLRIGHPEFEPLVSNRDQADIASR